MACAADHQAFEDSPVFRLVHETVKVEDDSCCDVVGLVVDGDSPIIHADQRPVVDRGRVSTSENVETIADVLHTTRCCLVETQSRRIGRTFLVAMLVDHLHREYKTVVLSTSIKKGQYIPRMLKHDITGHGVVFVPASAGCREIDDDVMLVIVDDANYIPRDVLCHYGQSGTRRCVAMCYPDQGGISNDQVASCIHYSTGRGVKSARKR